MICCGCCLVVGTWHTATHNEYSSIIFNQQFYWHTQTTRSEIWLMAAWVSSIRMHWTIHLNNSLHVINSIVTIITDHRHNCTHRSYAFLKEKSVLKAITTNMVSSHFAESHFANSVSRNPTSPNPISPNSFSSNLIFQYRLLTWSGIQGRHPGLGLVLVCAKGYGLGYKM